MKLAYTALIALVVAGSPVWAAAALTGPASGQSAYSTWSVPAMHAVQGQVKSVSPDGKTVTLINGMTFKAARNLSTEPLSGNEQITAMYKREGGQNVLTGFSIDAGPAKA